MSFLEDVYEENYKSDRIEELSDNKVIVYRKLNLENKHVNDLLKNNNIVQTYQDLVLKNIAKGYEKQLKKKYGEGFKCQIDPQNISWNRFLEEHGGSFDTIDKLMKYEFEQSRNQLELQLTLEVEDNAFYAYYNILLPSGEKIKDLENSNLSEGIDLSQVGIKLESVLEIVFRKYLKIYSILKK